MTVTTYVRIIKADDFDRNLHLTYFPSRLYVPEKFLLLERNAKLTPSGTLYHKRGRWLYASALMVMWISTIISFTGDWIRLRPAFVLNNSSPLDMLLNLRVSPPVFDFVFGTIANSISDAIIVRFRISIDIPLIRVRYGAPIYCGRTKFF